MPAKRVRVTPQAERDIDDETLYLSEAADTETAIRFFDATHATFKTLLTMPGIGRDRPVANTRIGSLKQWAVSDFDKMLIFYRIVSTGIEIIRVLHGERDIDRILNDETNPD